MTPDEQRALRETAPQGEDRETRIKRLRMRSMRRGTKEMDILLIRFTDAALAELDDARLDSYEALLSENDQDLYRWISGQAAAPAPHQTIVAAIQDIATRG
ncbi:succinate dehydrogenase assembly factor 2 [Cognatishimia sp. F0-27]|uniref:FAD assembly factor SdhE n=1 Tax=Cognatishimia sp. F0-27 TaxID=2816855 RepID=UPI001D0C1D4B|nr:succinate dehydrogenase assembly factor 2 [Cognatishimia sp. F0-27]MCC1494338.1 succinate dehydrogenase assembly factor 2 [Cognatishimia sp. F0-27]